MGCNPSKCDKIVRKAWSKGRDCKNKLVNLKRYNNNGYRKCIYKEIMGYLFVFGIIYTQDQAHNRVALITVLNNKEL